MLDVTTETQEYFKSDSRDKQLVVHVEDWTETDLTNINWFNWGLPVTDDPYSSLKDGVDSVRTGCIVGLKHEGDRQLLWQFTKSNTESGFIKYAPFGKFIIRAYDDNKTVSANVPKDAKVVFVLKSIVLHSGVLQQTFQYSKTYNLYNLLHTTSLDESTIVIDDVSHHEIHSDFDSDIVTENSWLDHLVGLYIHLVSGTASESSPITCVFSLQYPMLILQTYPQFKSNVWKNVWTNTLIDCSYLDLIEGKYADHNRPLDNKYYENGNLVSEQFSLTESLCSQDNLKFGTCESAHCTFKIADRNDDLRDRYLRINIKKADGTIDIPLGRFKIDKIRRQQSYSLITKQITAYDALADLTGYAGDWFRDYMVVVNTAGFVDKTYYKYSSGGCEYVRSSFGVYINALRRLGAVNDSDFMTVEQYDDFYPASANQTIQNRCYLPLLDDKSEYSIGYSYEYYSLSSTSIAGKYFRITAYSYYDTYFDTTDVSNYNSKEYVFNEDFLTYLGDKWLQNYGYIGTGIDSTAAALVTINTLHHSMKFVVDANEVIYVPKLICDEIPRSITISPSAGVVKVNTDTKIATVVSSVHSYYKCRLDEVKISERLNRLIPMYNMGIRLPYYNYYTRAVAPFSSSTSLRDVLRSILELSGCCFKASRDGWYELVYPKSSTLYPDINVYPSTDKFPTRPSFSRIDFGKYKRLIQEDYKTRGIGYIQILSGSNSDTGEHTYSLEYLGVATYNSDKSAYKMRDNIFLCSSGVAYSTKNQPELRYMLEDMFKAISDITYVPMELNLQGLPYLECGDTIRIHLPGTSGYIDSYVLRRTMKGIQSLDDTYTTKGDEYVPRTALGDSTYSHFIITATAD